MTVRKIFWLASLVLALVAVSPAYAKKRVDALVGLIPSGSPIKESDRPFTGSDLTGAHVAIIPSQNFLNYIEFAQKWFSPKRWRNGFGDRPSDDLSAFLAKASDPKVLTDSLVSELARRGATVTIASSFPEAREQGAKLYVVFDYFGKWGSPFSLADLNPFASTRYYWQSEGGIQIFNGRLERVLSIQSSGSATYKETGVWPGMDQQTLKLASAISQSQTQYLEGIVKQIAQLPD